MLKIEPAILEQVRSATKASDLYTHLQGAIELEHSTIPPYLTALYSIKKGSNREAAAIIRSVVMEEMLHMTIAANTLNAIGGAPEINTSGFIPRISRHAADEHPRGLRRSGSRRSRVT